MHIFVILLEKISKVPNFEVDQLHYYICERFQDEAALQNLQWYNNLKLASHVEIQNIRLSKNKGVLSKGGVQWWARKVFFWCAILGFPLISFDLRVVRPRFFYCCKELSQGNILDMQNMFISHVKNFLDAAKVEDPLQKL